MPIVGKDLLRAFYRLFYLKFCDSSDQWKKHCVTKILLAAWEIFLHENNRNYISYIFGYKFAFIVFLFISYEPKTRIWFSASWWSTNEKYFFLLFIASRVLLQSHAEFNRLYKGIFLHVIPVRIIVPCLERTLDAFWIFFQFWNKDLSNFCINTETKSTNWTEKLYLWC